MRWKLELSCNSFDIVYHPGRDNNISPDTLSRVKCAATAHDSFYKLHDSLCHHGVKRLWPLFSIQKPSILTRKNQDGNCSICFKWKQKFECLEEAFLLKQLNHLKGETRNLNDASHFHWTTTIYSRFPFVLLHYTVFSLIGIPPYVHSDRGVLSMNRELWDFLTSKGKSMSRPTS